MPFRRRVKFVANFVPLHKPRKVGFSDAMETAKRRYENSQAPFVLRLLLLKDIYWSLEP